jgi:hypothetical protein
VDTVLSSMGIENVARSRVVREKGWHERKGTRAKVAKVVREQGWYERKGTRAKVARE